MDRLPAIFIDYSSFVQTAPATSRSPAKNFQCHSIYSLENDRKLRRRVEILELLNFDCLGNRP